MCEANLYARRLGASTVIAKQLQALNRVIETARSSSFNDDEGRAFSILNFVFLHLPPKLRRKR